MSYNVMLEGLVKDIGGCGKFQWTVSAMLHLSKTICAWSMLHMTFVGQEPKFFCASSDDLFANRTENNITDGNMEQSCTIGNGTECEGFRYESDMYTIVSEWDLVCDRKWIVATITTIQMAGVLVGCFLSGHLGDWIGRKPTYFLSVLILVIFNVIAYFSVSWEMYASVRFMLGVGVGFFTTTMYTSVVEYTTSAWRPIVLAVPSWATECGAFALVSYLLKDWKNIHIASAVVGAPFLLSWWFVQESFRWLVTTGKYKRAESVIEKVAKLNGYEKPDISHIVKEVQLEKNKEKHYTVLDLFKTKESVIKTLALLFIWFGVSYSYYGLTFGLQFLKGDLYLNMFVMNIVEIPAEFLAMFLMKKFGRKKTVVVSMFVVGLCGIGDGVLQYVESPAKDALINTFAIGSKMGIAIGWGTLVVLTMEVYPTVIRVTAYGFANTSARIGGMIAPQIVFLNDQVPGLLFFLSGGVMIVASLLCLLIQETKGLVLEDALKTKSQSDKHKAENLKIKSENGNIKAENGNIKSDNGYTKSGQDNAIKSVTCFIEDGEAYENGNIVTF